MPINHETLRTEIQNDPIGYGYAADVAIGNDQAVANKLNLARTGANGGPAISVRRATVTRQELMDAIDTRDLKAAPTVLEGSILESILQADTITLTNPNGTVNRTRQNLNRLILDTQGSQGRLDTLAMKVGTRAEQLFGPDTNVTSSDVAKALRP